MGLLPLNVNKPPSPKIDRVLIFWSYFVITLNLTITCLALYHAESIFYTQDDTGKLNDWTKYVAVCSCFYVMLFESVLQRNLLKEAWFKFDFILCALRGEGLRIDEHLQHYRRKFLKKFYCVTIFNIIVTILDLRRMSLYSWIIVIPSLSSRYRHLQYAVHTIETHAIQKTLNEGIQSVVDHSKNEKNHCVDRLLCLKRVQSELFSMVQMINAYFGWSTTFNFAQDFIQITCDMYWIYMNTIGALEITNQRLYLLFKVCAQVTIVLCGMVLVHGASEFYVEQEKTSGLIHKIRRSKEKSDEMDDAIRHFSLQLRHEKIIFTANGFFDIDYSLMGNVSFYWSFESELAKRHIFQVKSRNR